MSGRKLTYKKRADLEALIGGSCMRLRGPAETAGQTLRIIGLVEGYFAVRYRGCVPFLVHWREFQKNYRVLNQVRD